jgi:DNA-binding MarR family transcriptional regulator
MGQSDGHTPEGALFTELVLEVFRLNGRLLTAGDELTRDLGLTSARWQVLGAIALAAAPLPVARIARTMGLTRQAVQRVANELAGEGFVRFVANPDHKRAKLVTLTERGRDAYARASQRQARWANRIAAGLTGLGEAVATLKAARGVLEADEVHHTTTGGSHRDERGHPDQPV